MPIISTNTLIFALIIVILALAAWVIYLEAKLRKFLVGKDAKTLEDSIVSIQKDLENFKKFEEESIVYFKSVEGRLKKSIQSVEGVRFNPFRGTGDGGNQSFSTVFLNEKGDGLILSSLYARDKTSLFSKPVKKFISEFELTEEEKNLLNTAREGLIIK